MHRGRLLIAVHQHSMTSVIVADDYIARNQATITDDNLFLADNLGRAVHDARATHRETCTLEYLYVASVVDRHSALFAS